MKKEISPAVFITVIVVVVLLVGVFIYRQAVVTPHTPRPNPKYFGGGMPGAPSATAAGTQKDH